MESALLPEEILAEILMRLDVKSLIRSSCVCKSWRVLIIETPHFGDKHLNHWKHLKNNDDAVVFLRYPRGDVKDQLVTFDDSQSPPFLYEDLELPFQSTDKNLLVRECNGILCIAECVNLGSVHLCNLTTLEHLVLPPGLFEDDAVYVTENLGFGFDQSTNDYKVIRIKHVRRANSRMKRMLKEGLQVPGRKKCVEVYRVSTNSWSELNVTLRLQDRICSPGVFLNGFCHWWDGARTPTRWRGMVTFDFKGERFGKMRIPFTSSYSKTATIDVLDDSLAVCFTMMNSGFELWVMSEYGNQGSWTRQFVIYNSLLEPDSYWFHDNNRVVIRYPGRFFVCPLEEKDRPAKTRFFEYNCCNLSGTSSTVFRPTLVSLRNRLPVSDFGTLVSPSNRLHQI